MESCPVVRSRTPVTLVMVMMVVVMVMMVVVVVVMVMVVVMMIGMIERCNSGSLNCRKLPPDLPADQTNRFQLDAVC